ncbi:MAG: hypothetical protein Q3962_09050 [Corynebacterium sp.]|nr:hypothetical protein [Corynebacterium sp.]
MAHFDRKTHDSFHDAFVVLIGRAKILEAEYNELMYRTNERIFLGENPEGDKEWCGMVQKLLTTTEQISLLMTAAGFEMPDTNYKIAQRPDRSEDVEQWHIAASIFRECALEWLRQDAVPGIYTTRFKVLWDALHPEGWEERQAYSELMDSKDAFNIRALVRKPKANDSTADDPDYDIPDYADQVEAWFKEDEMAKIQLPPEAKVIMAPGPNGDPFEILTNIDPEVPPKPIVIKDEGYYDNAATTWSYLMEAINVIARYHFRFPLYMPEITDMHEAFLRLGVAYGLIPSMEAFLNAVRIDSPTAVSLEQQIIEAATAQNLDAEHLMEMELNTAIDEFRIFFKALLKHSDFTVRDAKKIAGKYINLKGRS